MWTIREIKEFLALANNTKRTSLNILNKLHFGGNASDLSCNELEGNVSDAFNRQGIHLALIKPNVIHNIGININIFSPLV